MTIGQDCLVGVDAEAVQALVDGRHGDPFSILGPHSRGSTSTVRALAPGAQAIDVVAREDSSLLGRLELAHPGGLFAGPVVGEPPLSSCASAGPMRSRRRRIPTASVFCSATSICI